MLEIYKCRIRIIDICPKNSIKILSNININIFNI